MALLEPFFKEFCEIPVAVCLYTLDKIGFCHGALAVDFVIFPKGMDEGVVADLFLQRVEHTGTVEINRHAVELAGGERIHALPYPQLVFGGL